MADLGNRRIVDLTDKLPRHPTKRYRTRALATISTIVVHHSATETGTPEAFARYHVEANGWPDIGYHYVIGKDGTVWKTNRASTISYHAGNANGHSLGVCLVGNFDREQPTQAQWLALVELLNGLMQAFGISADRVVGHREVPGTRKSCPGRNISMDALRRQLQGR